MPSLLCVVKSELFEMKLIKILLLLVLTFSAASVAQATGRTITKCQASADVKAILEDMVSDQDLRDLILNDPKAIKAYIALRKLRSFNDLAGDSTVLKAILKMPNMSSNINNNKFCKLVRQLNGSAA